MRNWQFKMSVVTGSRAKQQILIPNIKMPVRLVNRKPFSDNTLNCGGSLVWWFHVAICSMGKLAGGLCNLLEYWYVFLLSFNFHLILLSHNTYSDILVIN